MIQVSDALETRTKDMLVDSDVVDMESGTKVVEADIASGKVSEGDL